MKERFSPCSQGLLEALSLRGNSAVLVPGLRRVMTLSSGASGCEEETKKSAFSLKGHVPSFGDLQSETGYSTAFRSPGLATFPHAVAQGRRRRRVCGINCFFLSSAGLSKGFSREELLGWL